MIKPHVFELGPWTPDAPALAANGVIVARNCVPTAYGYAPFEEYAAETDALTAYARGAILTRDETDVAFMFAGDETKLYQDVAGSWSEVGIEEGAAIELTGLGTNLGDMTGGGGLVAAFDDDTTQAAAACAAEAASTSAWVGKTLPTAKSIHKVVVHGSNDAGFVSAINPTVTIKLYGKNGTAPASATDGTLIGTTSFTDTADESAGRTITSTDRDTVWDHVFINVTHNGAANQINVAELVIHETDRYDTASEDGWELIRWRDQVLATNYTNDPQEITLGDANFADLTTALKIKHWAVVRNFVMAGWTNDGVDGEVPWRVRWCAFNDPSDWTVSPTTLADYEDLYQKKIQRVFGGEYGIIMQDTAITRATFVGAPTVFQFDEVVNDIGLIAPGAAVQLGDKIFFLSERGFYELVAGSQIRPIGVGKVDKTVLTDLDGNYLHRISAVADPNNNRVVFGYPGQGNVDGTPNKIVIYDPSIDKWSEAEQEHELLWVAAGAATVLEDFDTLYGDLDTMDVSFDSSRWIGGNEQLAMFDTSHQSGFFDGGSRDATITTREYMFDGEQRVRVRGYRPLVRGTGVEVSGRVGYRNDIADDPSYTDTNTPNTGGRITCRTNARYHRFELTVSGQWTEAFGVMVEGKDLGPGGRRG